MFLPLLTVHVISLFSIYDIAINDDDDDDDDDDDFDGNDDDDDDDGGGDDFCGDNDVTVINHNEAFIILRCIDFLQILRCYCTTTTTSTTTTTTTMKWI